MLRMSLIAFGLSFFSMNTFACIKVKDNSKDGYACAKVNGKGQLYTHKKDNSKDGYKVVTHGKAPHKPSKPSKPNHTHTTVHHYNSSSYYHGPGYYSGGYNHGPYYDTGHTTYTGSVYTTCAPEMVGNNVNKTDALAVNMLGDKRFENETVFTNTLRRILDTENDEAKLKAYFSLVNVQTTEDIVYFIGARDDEFDRYEANLIANTDLEPALAKIVVSKMIKSLRNN